MFGQPNPMFLNNPTGSGFSPVDFSSHLLENMPNLSQDLIPTLKQSIVDIFVLREFSRDDFNTMREEVNTMIPIGHAVVIGREGRFFLTARHLLNEYLPQELVFFSPATQEFYSFYALEDGAEQGLDYLLGSLEQFDTVLPEYPPPMAFGESPSTVAMIHLISWQENLESSYEPTNSSTLMESSFFSSRESNCGLPWVNPTGQLFALHCKRCEMPLFGQQRTGLSIALLLQSSKLVSGIHQDTLFYKDTLTIKFDPTRFAHFTTASYLLSEVDEGGKRRDFAVGPTPSISSWSATPKQVLYRFFVNGRAKLVVPNKPEVTIGSLEQVHGTNTKKIKNAIHALIDKDNYKLHWQVSVFETVKDKIRTFVPLFRGDIHMGHILPAVAFWNEGAQNFLDEQCDEINGLLKKRKITKEQAANKITYISDCLTPYVQPGMESWINGGQRRTGYIKTFMDDSNNYEFETGVYNDVKSAEEKKKYGSYQALPGYEWKNVSTTSHDKFELVPFVPVTYKTFTHLDGAFQIRDAGSQNYKSVNEFPWLTTALEDKPRAKTDFVKDKLNDKFELQIDTSNLNKPQKQAITRFFEVKNKKMGDNFTYTQGTNFFRVTYQNTLTSGKVKRNQIYDVAEDIVSNLNTFMKP